MDQSEQGRKISRIIAKAWADDGFKKRLLSDAKAVLNAEGLDVPADLEVQAVEDTENVFHFVLPAKPSEAELSEEVLSAVAGGDISACCSSRPSGSGGGCGGGPPGHCCSSQIPICAPTPDGKPPKIPSFSENCQMCSNIS
jgi:hypothetical protein